MDDTIWYYTDKLQSLSDVFHGKSVGDFIIRPSRTVPNGLTLVIKNQLYLFQMRIITNNDGDFALELPPPEITRSLLLYAPLELHSKSLHSLICNLKQQFQKPKKPKLIGADHCCVHLNKPIRVRTLSLKHSCRILILKQKLNYSNLPLSIQSYLNDFIQDNNEW